MASDDLIKRLLNSQGKEVWSTGSNVKISAYGKILLPTDLTLPNETDGFVLLAEFVEEGKYPIISRRYLKVGDIKVESITSSMYCLKRNCETFYHKGHKGFHKGRKVLPSILQHFLVFFV